MNLITIYNLLAVYLAKYNPQEMDKSLKPRDSSGCLSCREMKYDFIIVGAGSAGCVVANRLSANKHMKVLLIEAGDDEDYRTDLPFAVAQHDKTRVDWNYTTIKQKHSCLVTQGICRFPRGYVMGGSSAINGMMYVRGAAEDYDHWDDLGNPGWSHEDVLPYFLKAENMTIPELANSPYHSTKGPLSVGYPNFRSKVLQDYLQATIDFGLPEVDYNGANQFGTAFTQLTTKTPTRCSTSKAYLDPIRNRKNLYIFKNTEVIKVLLCPKKRKVIGVRCVTRGQEYDVYVKKEVILSAGAINTPKLLMLSGVGPREELEKHNIPVCVELPGVGRNLIDHNYLTMQFVVNSKELDPNDEMLTEAVLEYARDGKGMLTSPQPAPINFYFNSSSNVTDIQVLGGAYYSQFSSSKKPLIIASLCNLKPKSIGSVTLSSANYSDPPLIDPNYLAVSSDYIPFRVAIKTVLKIMDLPSLKQYSPKWLYDTNICNYTDTITEEFLDCFISYYTVNGFHPVGTAKMGPPCDYTSVTNAKLKVHKIKNLRVVDASIMPTVPSGNTNAPVIMVAEKASDIIIRDHSCGC